MKTENKFFWKDYWFPLLLHLIVWGVVLTNPECPSFLALLFWGAAMITPLIIIGRKTHNRSAGIAVLIFVLSTFAQAWFLFGYSNCESAADFFPILPW
ncbi:MAG: hypothetical protein AAB583_06660 [Patescibacteria group bacterium]